MIDETSYKVNKYLHSVIMRLRYLVSFKALELINSQVKAAIDSITKGLNLPPYTNAFRQQYGLPCRYTIRQLIERNA